MYNRYTRGSGRDIVEFKPVEIKEVPVMSVSPIHRGNKITDIFSGLKLNLDITDLLLIGILFLLYLESDDDEMLIAIVILVAMNMFS